MESHDLQALSADLPLIQISKATTEEEAMAAVRGFSQFDGRMVGVFHFAGLSPWERHPDQDELLYVLDGEVEVTVLSEGGASNCTVRAGSVCIIPKGLWHRQLPKPAVKLMFITGATDVSWDENPLAPRR